MEADTPLDYATFLLSPTRTRCELVVSSGDRTEKLASGLLQPFLTHIKAVNEEIDKGGCSIKLAPAGEDASLWFTKGTMERFVRFVNTPEVLERVCCVDNELCQLEETLSRNNDSCLSGCETPVSRISSSSKGLENPSQENSEQIQEYTSDGLESSNSQLLKALEARRSALQKEKSMAFARAEAAGFSAENTSNLRRFAKCFGASRLSDACENYMRFSTKKRETEIWIEQIPSDLAGGNTTEIISEPCSNFRNDETRETSREAEKTIPVPFDQEEASIRSVQEKITMFEGKKKGNDDKRRMSAADIGRTDSEKPVLRRWSLAAEKLGQKSTSVRKGREAEQFSEVDGNKFEEPGVNKLDNNVTKIEAEDTVFKSPETEDTDLSQEMESDVVSDTQSLKDTKGRFYDTYREMRDAKLREEGSAKKAEKQARLKVMQESLDRRRAEVAKNLRSSKSDPLAEARIRAEKLRAFKAGLLEIKRAKQEEEERKRLEELRLQRTLKKAGAQAPGSPHSGASTPRAAAKVTNKGFLPTFQRANTATQTSQSVRPRKTLHTGSQAGPSECLRKAPQEKADAILVKANPKKKDDSTKLRGMILRRSVPSSNVLRRENLVQRTEVARLSDAAGSGLKFLDPAAIDEMFPGNAKADGDSGEEEGEETAAAVIRAPVTTDDDLLPVKVVHENHPGSPRVMVNDDHHLQVEVNEYHAPVAPVSISPVVIQAYNA